MSIVTEKYIRKPLYVDAVRITTTNFGEIAAWCQGQVLWKVDDRALSEEEFNLTPSEQYIKVRVHNPKNPRQTQAFVGDWLLYTPRGYKIYTNKAFHALFDVVQNEVPPMATVAVPPNTVEDAPEQESVVPAAVEGKRVLSIKEQKELTADEVRELVQSGEAVLAQDISDTAQQ